MKDRNTNQKYSPDLQEIKIINDGSLEIVLPPELSLKIRTKTSYIKTDTKPDRLQSGKGIQEHTKTVWIIDRGWIQWVQEMKGPAWQRAKVRKDQRRYYWHYSLLDLQTFWTANDNFPSQSRQWLLLTKLRPTQ